MYHLLYYCIIYLQFAGFSADALADRILDSKCKLLVTVDSVYRGEKMIHLKEICDNGKYKMDEEYTPFVTNMISNVRCLRNHSDGSR